jgi:ATP-dependent helicase/nuclease subunit A
MTQPKTLVEATGLSEEQKPAVLELNRDVVVTAGAGAGKTRTLVGRYLALLEKGTPPRRIAAITFTRKAAREMRNRVREEIDKFTHGLPAGSPEAQHWEDIQRQLDAARIGTIHELCSQILRTHPAEAGIDPRFNMLEEGSMAWLQSEAVTDSLAWAVDQPRLSGLFREVEAMRLREILLELLRKGTQPFTSAITAGERLAEWEGRLANEQETKASIFLDDAGVRDAFKELSACTPVASDDRLVQQQALVLNAFAAAQAGAKWQALAELAEVKMVGGSQNAWAGGKDEKQLVSDCLKLLREQWKNGPGALPPSCHDGDRTLAELQEGVSDLLAHAADAYRQRKHEREALDFEDLEQMALQLLRENDDVLRYWQQQLDALLVDEYQDTNDRQRTLINLLGGERGNLFIVGDGKQSIYRFRGAEVSVFGEEQQRIAHRGGLRQELSTSYRPHAALLAALNTFLPRVMGKADTAEEPWRVPFAPLRHHREKPRFGLSGPYVALDLAVGNKQDALPRAAKACASRIASLKEQHRKLRYDDIAILCRSSGSFVFYEDALEAHGIPYQTIAGRGFYERPEIRDLLNALDAVVEPADDLALYGFLRSPVIGFDDGALYRLRRRQMANAVPTLWLALKEEGGETARRAVTLLKTLHRIAGRSEAAAVLHQLLEMTDYTAALQRAGEGRAARNIAKLLADAQQSGLVHLHDFLAYVRDVQQQVRASEARATVADAVQIMSVHQAKGLEFPVVIIGDINHQGGRGGSGLVIDPELGILFKPNGSEEEPAILRLAKLRESAHEEAESDRIFYVAATRARDMLLMNGTVHLGTKGPSAAGWLKQLLPPLGLEAAIEWEAETGDTHKPRTQIPAVTCTLYGGAYVPPAPRLSEPEQEVATSDAWRPALAVPIEPPPPREAGTGRGFWRVVPAAQRATAPAWLIGTLVHEALAAWRFPSSANDANFGNWVGARARSLGLGDDARLASAMREVSTLLRRLQRHPLYEQISRAHRMTEVPYAYEEDGAFFNGTIDLLFEDGAGWHLVDYKSDAVLEVATAADRPLYEEQVRRYARAVKRLTGFTPSCSICWLNVRGTIVQHPVPSSID